MGSGYWGMYGGKMNNGIYEGIDGGKKVGGGMNGCRYADIHTHTHNYPVRYLYTTN